MQRAVAQPEDGDLTVTDEHGATATQPYTINLTGADDTPTLSGAAQEGKALFDNQGAFLNLIIPAECDKSLKPGKDFTFFLMPKYDASMPEAQFVSGDLFVGAKDTKNQPATLALLTLLPALDLVLRSAVGHLVVVSAISACSVVSGPGP